MSYAEIVYRYLERNGSITAKGIEDISGTTCPHAVIMDIRKKYGYDCITYEDRKKTKIVIENGKEKKETKLYREWFLKKLEN